MSHQGSWWGLLLIIIGSGNCVFAKKVFDFSQKLHLPGSRITQYDEWPSWFFPVWVWTIPKFGLLVAFIGVGMVLDNL